MNISNSNSNRIIDGSSSADSISNTGASVSIYAYSGDDTIENYGSEVYIEAGKGNDSIYNNYPATIYAGDGADTVYSDEYGNSSYIDGGAGNDSIYSNNNYGNYDMTILGGAGADTISGYYGNSSISGGADADIVSIGGSYNSYNTIGGGDGNDTIYNSTDESTLNGDEGNDFIYNTSNYNFISGNAGDDFISLGSSTEENTISGGAGNDTIILQNQNHLLQYASGDGNDIIEGFNRSDTLQITSGSISKAGYSGDDAIIYVGNNYIIFKDSAERTLNLQIGNGAAFSTVLSTEIDFNGGEGEDTGGGSDTGSGGDDDEENYIINSTASTLISGGSGADNITNSGKNVTILGNAGDDFIFNTGANVLINGGAGNDTINNTGKNATIIGGAGNDKISLSSAATGTLIKYSSGDGKDTLYGFDTNDSLEVSGGSYTTSKSGSDILVTFDSGSLLIKNTSSISIIGGSSGGGDDDENELPDGWKYANTAKTSITATLATADDLDLTEDYGDGVIKVDSSKTTGGVKIIGNDLNNSIKGGKGDDEIAGGSGNDTVSLGAGNDTYIYSSGNDLIQDYAAGDIIQIDTGEIEINGVETSGTNILITTSEGNLIIKNGASKEISLVDADGEEIDLGGEDEITLPDGWKFGTSSKTNDNAEIITATLKTAENIDLTESYGEGVVSVNAATITTGVEITANDLDNSIKGSKGADIISGGYGNDTVSLGAGADTYIYTSGNDLIQDYTAGQDVIKFETEIESASLSGSNLIITTSEGKVTVKGGKDKNISVIDSNDETLTILNEYPVEEITLPDGWKYGTAAKTNTNAEIITATLKTAENIDLTEPYGEGVVSINAAIISTGVEITANDLDNSIKGSKGADYISGGYGNDTVSLGAGDDVYIYSGGDDYISDYVAGHDSIQIAVDNVENITANTIGANVVYTMDEGTLTVAKGSGKVITLMDVNGDIINVGSKIPAGWQLTNNILKATVASADNEIDLNEAYGDGVTKVDASKMSSGVEIIGNDSNVSLKGGKGNDILAGGSGNDTLTSGTGDDLFIYTGGDDYITDYTAGKDSIQIDISEIEIYSMETVGTNVVYATDAGNITVKSGANKQITLIDADGAEIVIGSNAIPTGWSFDSSKKILKATVASAENDIDLTEAYGDGVQKVDGSKITGGVVIFGNDEDNSIKGGKGADEISGGSGNDTVSLGGGADIYIYNGGDDVIQDYVAGTDSIQINTGDIEVTGLSTVGNDIIYETSSGNIKVIKGKGKNITLMDEDGAEVIIGGAEYPEGWKFDSTKGLLQATISTAADEIDLSESYGAGVEKVDGSKITSGVVIYGSDDNISMKGSKGNDTISGGTGNDTVSLGGGADVYIYNGGNDYIHDYANVDAIQIDTDEIAITGIATVSTNKIIETSEGNITLKSGKTKTLNLIDANGEEISFNGRIAENVWFLEDDNNFENCAIDDITENKFAVTEIQSSKVEELYQPVLTFAEDK